MRSRQDGTGRGVMVVLAGVAVMLAAVVQAEDGPLHQLAPVSVVGSEQNLAQLAGSGAYLDAEVLGRMHVDDINQALRRVPGVYVRPEDGYGLFPNISLRGVDGGRSSKVTVMEDGVLAAPAPYAAPAAYYTPTTGRMSAIEVLKGSSQVRYGPQTSGGVINYQSTPIPRTAGGRLRLLYGTDHELRNHVYWGDTVDSAIGRVGYLVELYDRRSEGFKSIDGTPDFTATDRTGFRKTEPMLKLAWEPDTVRYQRLELKLGYTDLVANETYMGLSEADYAANPYRRYAGSRFDMIVTEQFRSHLRYQLELTPDARLTTTAYYHEFNRDWYKERSNGAAIADPDKLAVLKGEAAGTLRYRSNNREYTSTGIETVLEVDFATGRLLHSAESGLRLHRDDIRRFQRDDTYVQAANGTITDRLIGAPGSGGNRAEEATAMAAYVQDAVSFDRLTLIPGVRVEVIRMTYTDFDTGGEPDRVTGKGNDTLTVVAPGLGAIVALSDQASVFGGVYRGFSIPGPRAYVRGIEEETSIGYALGTRYGHASGFTGELVVFYTDFDKLVVPDTIGAGGIAATTENAGDIVIYGLELKLAYDAGEALGLGLSNPWYLAATWTQAEIDSATGSLDEESIFAGGRKGAKVPYVPALQGLFGTGLEAGGWGLFAELVVVDSTYTSASNVSAPVDTAGRPNSAFGKTDSYVLVDVSGFVRLREGVRLTGSVHNLFDTDYLVARHPAGPRPGRPRTAQAGLEVLF